VDNDLEAFMRLLTLLVLPALLLTACGGEDTKSNTVDLRGDEYAYVMPEKIEGGWTTLEFANTGDELHEFALAKLGPGKTIGDVKKYLADPKAQQGPPPDWVQIRAGIPTLAEGEEASLTQQLEPGRYLLLCFLDGPDGRTHIEHGMLKTFDVEGDAGAEPPKTDATLDLGADLAAPRLEGGIRTLELRNDTDKPGSVFLTAFEPGKTEPDLTRWEENGMRGPAPARFLGGAIDVPAHSSVYYTITLEQGREYTLLDDEHGIQRTFTPS
jgi:hypothetical protein